MNIKRWVQASIAVFGVIFVLEFVIHGILLKGIYEQTASVWRPTGEMRSLMWLMWVGYLIFAPVFVFIYAGGYEKEKGGLGQGIRFGLAMGLLTSATQSLGWYAVLPIPPVLAAAWFLAGMAESLAAGIVVGRMYQAV